jgi:hypothetical protein
MTRLLLDENDGTVVAGKIRLGISLESAANAARRYTLPDIIVMLIGQFPLPSCCSPIVTELNTQASDWYTDRACEAFKQLGDLAHYRCLLVLPLFDHIYLFFVLLQLTMKFSSPLALLLLS